MEENPRDDWHRAERVAAGLPELTAEDRYLIREGFREDEVLTDQFKQDMIDGKEVFCQKCGKSWAETLRHEPRRPSAHDEDFIEGVHDLFTCSCGFELTIT